MKHIYIALLALPTMVWSQNNVAYTVKITKLMALADDCDGGAPFCLNAPQDPVFNIWTSDGEANENTNCWIFDGDPEAEYGLWKDIQNLEIANETGVNTNYISFDMSGFESDALTSPGCSSSSGDDQVFERQFVEQFLLSTIPMDSTYVDTINLGGVYYAQIEIYWTDLNASLFKLEEIVDFVLAPNPNNGSFTLQFSDQIQAFSVRVMDISGRTVYADHLVSNQGQIQLGDEAKGMYFVHVEADGKKGIQRILVD